IPGLDICFHMESATEIGGDYYDYSLADDGALTIAIGDATGHGMKAGTMVSIVKGLFITHSPITDMPGFFRKCARAIKQMRLGNLYMALMLVTIKDRELTASAAGMPPVYIRRGKTGAVETLLMKGMPLGGPLFDNYQVRKAKLFPGDTVLLMSDGFPELFNDQKEMLDYPRVEAIFREAGEKSATGIVRHLCDAGIKWANGRPPDDDITFVVVKIRTDSGLSDGC
ncbi:MAG: SpoIIE family protein phosphatase, partial [Calditrichaeota bacterium]|nr:SpoIIE family protein phosphatase [Calditrichota bacterium]